MHAYCMEAGLHKGATSQRSPPIIALFGFLAIRPAYAAISTLLYLFRAMSWKQITALCYGQKQKWSEG